MGSAEGTRPTPVKKTSQHAAPGKEVQVPLTGLNRTLTTMLLPGRTGGTNIFLKQLVVTREGAHFCYSQVLPDFADCVALAILLLPSATFVENLTGKLGWTM